MEMASPRFLVAGRMTRDYILLPDGQALLDIPGGNALYAAVGLAVWEPDPPPAIAARVGEDYPEEWIERFSRGGLDLRGVRRLAEPVDARSFVAFTGRSNRSSDNPVAHFSRLGLPFPHALLNYTNPREQLDSRTHLQVTSLRQGDLPAEYLDCTAAHLAPLDYLTHSVLPAILRQYQFTTITLDPAHGYMNSTFFENVPALLTGLTAFLPSEDEALALYQGRSSDLLEIAEALGSYGCELIVIKRGESGQLVYDAASRAHWEIPPYPARLSNPIGAGDAFCGGFIAGYRRSYDPVEAALYGNVSASLVVEGNDPLYAQDALPGLAQARLDSLRLSVRRM